MEVVINKVEINEKEITAIIQLKAFINDNFSESRYGISNNNIIETVFKKLVDEYYAKLMVERGPAIMKSITNNQIINAILMKAGGITK